MNQNKRVQVKQIGTSSWQREQKRSFFAPKLSFLITAPPSLRRLLQYELALFGYDEAQEHGAGWQIHCRLKEIYSLLLGLKTASKIYLLIDGIKAGAREELFKRLSDMMWEQLLPAGTLPHIRADLHRCRMSHEGVAEKTAGEAIRRRFRSAGWAGDFHVEHRLPLVVYGADNRFELRLDLCGEHLHKRGYRRLVSDAPIRETLAAAVLLWYSRYSSLLTQLWDPFCGSGTIPIEAWSLVSRRPLAAQRFFSLELLPLYRDGGRNWAAQHLMEKAVPLKNSSFFGSDWDKKMVSAARENARSAGAEDQISFFHADFFSLCDFPAAGIPLILANPPYGHRLSGGNDGASALYSSIVSHWRRHFVKADLLLIRPSTCPLPKADDSFSFDNGGISCEAALFRGAESAAKS